MEGDIVVLYVDTEDSFAKLIREYLEGADSRFTVEWVSDAEAALDFLTVNHVDCIISDYDMPGKNGIELLENVRDSFGDIPFVLFTGKGSETVASEAISAGVSDYLQKSPRSEQFELLANRLTTLVSKRHAENDLQTRLFQQEILCELSQAAMIIRETEALFDCTMRNVVDALGTEFAKILEYRTDANDFILRGGHGWTLKDEETTLSADRNSQAGYTLRTEEPVIVDDLKTEERFEVPTLLSDHGVSSGISVIIGGEDDPWGVLGTHSTEPCSFTQDDINFVQSVANILGAAIDQSRSERELAKSKARFEALFEQSPDIVVVHDMDGKITELNELATRKLGYSREELLDMTIWDIDPHAEHARARDFWDDLAIGETEMFESEHVKADGSTFPVEVHLIRIEAESGEFLAITRDTSRRKQRERELERQTNRLETFVDSLTHDIPNHLNVANGNLDLAKELDDPTYFDRVEGAHQRIESLIDDIREMAKAGSEVSEQEWVQLSDIAETSWKNCCSPDTDAYLEIVKDGKLRANPGRLTQLFENLYWNACDHAGADVTVSVGITDDGFYVEDDGPGIPPEKRDSVLEPGFTTASDTHTGFGLTIVREIVDAHGWYVRVTESDDGGAHFEFADVASET